MVHRVLVAGKSHSRAHINLDTFKSRAAMHATFSGYGGTFLGNDIQAGAMMATLDSAAKKHGREIYAVSREGLDLIQNPMVISL